MECDTRSRRPVAVKDEQTGNESSYSISPLDDQGGISLSGSEKVEDLTERLETQFQVVTDPSFPAVIEVGNVALRSS